MRLYELAGTRFSDDLANLLKVMQGRADDEQTQSTVTWPALNRLIGTYGHGEVTKDIVEKVRDQIDPNNELIQDIDDSGIVLKTTIPSAEKPADKLPMPKAKSVDQMAFRAARRELK